MRPSLFRQSETWKSFLSNNDLKWKKVLHIVEKIILLAFNRYVTISSTSNYFLLKMIFQISDCLKKLGLMCNSYLNRTLNKSVMWLLSVFGKNLHLQIMHRYLHRIENFSHEMQKCEKSERWHLKGLKFQVVKFNGFPDNFPA